MSTTLLLLADSLGDGFREFSKGSKSASDYWIVFSAVGLLVSGAAALFFWDRKREITVRDESTPESLFRELCNEHRLSPTERELLLKVVGSGPNRLEQPALVFVDPSILAGWLARGEITGLEGLVRKLFGR
jgi:hypothetical protein